MGALPKAAHLLVYAVAVAAVFEPKSVTYEDEETRQPVAGQWKWAAGGDGRHRAPHRVPPEGTRLTERRPWRPKRTFGPAVTSPSRDLARCPLSTLGQAAIIALALLSHTGSAAGWAMLDCLSTESFDSSVRGAA